MPRRRRPTAPAFQLGQGGVGPGRRHAFVAFAGGGARGLVHVGALKALSNQSIDVVGVAGTSAGAIVATLCAAGYTADEMVDPVTGRTLFDQLREIDPRFHSATAIFGPGGWGRVSFVYEMVRDLTFFRGLAGGLLVAGLVLAPAASHSFQDGWAVSGLLSLALMGLLAMLVVGLLRGLACLEEFVHCLGVLLQRKLFPDYPDRVVTFGDFGHSGRPILKVVASEISSGRLKLFPRRPPRPSRSLRPWPPRSACRWSFSP